MTDTNIPIQIEVRPPSSSDVDAVVRSFADIKARVEAQGRELGQTTKRATGDMSEHVKSYYKVIDKLSSDQSRANIEYVIREKREIENIQKIQQARDIEMYKASVKAFQDAEKQKAAAIKASSPAGIFQSAGIRSPQDIQNELNYLNQAKQLWLDAGKSTEGYKGALEQIDRRMNVLTVGNARARGEFHRLTAALASLSFELTGAVYGITSFAAILGGPALLGINFLKTIEDARLGMTGILISMGKINGEAIKLPQALSIASEVTSNLAASSIKYAISMEDLINTFRSILAPGLAAGMTLKQIEQVSTIGTIAVKSIGLDSKQVVQEIRDLVAGGIQAASSTLATSLGVTDKDIKAIKNANGDLFEFLMGKLEGFRLAASERTNTLGGAFELLKLKVTRLFVDESGFQGIKNALNSISNYIGVIDEKTGTIKFNEGLIQQVQSYWNGLKLVGDVLGKILQLIGFIGEHLNVIAAIAVPWFAGTRLLPVLASWKTGIEAFGASAITVFSNFKKDREIIGSTSAAMFALGSTGEGLVSKFKSLSVGAKGGIVGLLLWGTYELADYFGVIDSLFSNMYKRMDEFDKKVKSSSKLQLESQLSSLELREKQLQDSKKSQGRFFGVFGSGEKELSETQNQIAILRTQLGRMADSASVESAVAVGQSTKRIQDILNKGKDPTTVKKEYEDQISLIKRDTEVRLKNAKTIEDQNLIRSEERRAMAIAKKELEQNLGTAKDARKLQIEENSIEAINKRQNALNTSVKQYISGLEDAIELREFELSLAGKRSDEIALMRADQSAQKELNKIVADYKQQLIDIGNNERLNAKDKQAARDRLNKDLFDNVSNVQKANEANQDSIKKTFEKQDSAMQGGKNAWNSYANGATTAAQQIGNMFGKVFKGMEDGLVEFVKTGKISFTGLVNSMIDDMIRMAAHSTVKNTLGAIGTSFGTASKDSTASENFFGSIAKSVAGLFSAHGNAFDTSGHIQKFAKGGQFTNSLVSQPTMFAFANGGAFGMMGEAGPEAVMPLTRTPSGDLGVRATGGSGVSVMVNVNIDSNGNSTTTTDGGQLKGIGDVLGALVANEIVKQQRPGGLLNNLRK